MSGVGKKNPSQMRGGPNGRLPKRSRSCGDREGQSKVDQMQLSGGRGPIISEERISDLKRFECNDSIENAAICRRWKGPLK